MSILSDSEPLAGEKLANLMKSNLSVLIESEFAEIADPEYEQFLADVWVGIVLTLMVLSCVCCMCSCLLYHKFQQWKRSVIEARQAAELESGIYSSEMDALPSYTIASGLPSYEEALEQLRQVKEVAQTKPSQPPSANGGDSGPAECPTSGHPRFSAHRLSVTELFQIYRICSSTSTPSPNLGNCVKT